MCSISGILFGTINLSRKDIEGKRIIEIGSHDINGTLRAFVESRNPAEYIGVDIEKGPGVDIICDAKKIIEHFEKESFDIVIATELIEHVREWRKVISNIKNICRPNGIMLITTRSIGFQYHGFPHDFWRYESEDMKNIFSDCTIEKLEKDQLKPGVFFKARKPADFTENNLDDYELYSIILDRRIKEIDEKSLEIFQKKYNRYLLKQKVKNFINRYILSKI
jgi:2-polyprenyl-3-methyl-5-hydroxy-6-metoxy-1,4-benzoquinol methylase